MTIRSEIPVRNELGRLGRSRSVSVWLGERIRIRYSLLDGDH